MYRLSLFLCCLLALLVLSFGQTRQRSQVTFGRTDRSTSCTIEMVGTEATRRREATITARVVCDERTLYDQELPLTELDETPLDHGIRLFAETSFGMAYVYMGEETDANLVGSLFRRLPEFGSGEMAAPLVITDANLDITNVTFMNNQAAYRSGAMIVSGSSNVDLLNCIFSGNVGEEGALHVTESARVDVDVSYFELNNGTEVGAIKIDGRSVASVSECVFRADYGSEMANEIYVTDDATAIIDESSIDGEDAGSDFDAFLKDPSRPESDAENFALPIAAIAAVSGKSTVLFSDSSVGGHVGRFGAIYVTGAPVFQALRTEFSGNRGVTGGGLFVNSQRAGYARVMECTFKGNTARNGGALVFAGNGTYVIDECTFKNNTALNGGAVWGDYSEDNRCPRGSAGSRITIQDSTFAQNMAIQSGGAFFIRCTDIYAEDSVFRQNRAMDGDGGFVNAGSTFDLRFSGCDFDQNTASGNGGAIYVEDMHDIVSDACTWTGNRAGRNGGAIASINGNEILFKNSELRKSFSGKHGGGVFGSNLKRIKFRDTSTERNEAGGRGGVISGSNVSEFRWRDVIAKMNRAAIAAAIDINGGDLFEVKQMQFPDHKATTGDAGAIQLNGVQNITIRDVDFLQNEAAKSCGAFSIRRATNVIISDALLEANVGKRGGAVCLDDVDRVDLSSIRFDSNIAENGDGGALYANASRSVSLSDVVFINNNASRSGGALSIADAGDVEMMGCFVESNRANDGDGGAINLNGGQSLSMTNVTLLENEASESGGALSLADAGDVEMMGCVIESNRANDGDGGAINLKGGQSLSLTNITLIENKAVGSGGALSIADAGDVGMIGCVIESNRASNGDGGAFHFNRGQSLSMTNVTLLENEASESGGALSLADAGDVEMIGCFVESNRANDGDGGAINLKGGQSLSMTNITLLKNNASGSGGSVALTNLGSASLEETKVMNSTAPFSAGGLLADNVAKMTLNGSSFSRCVSRDGGAAYFKGFSEIEGQNMSFELNSAENGGGAFLCRQQTKVDLKGSHFYHNAARDGSTLNADCNCQVDIQDSEIYRDEDRPNNGDFFKTNRDCSSVSTLGNNFFGRPENTDTEWYEWLAIIGGAVLGFLLLSLCFCLWRRRRAATKGTKRMKSDIESQADEKGEDGESEEDASDEEEDSDEEYETDDGDTSSDGDEDERRRRE